MQFYIKEARELAGYSQKELAEIVGVAPNTFHGYESGKHDPKSALLVKIASACHVSVDYLLTGKMTGEWIALSGKQNAPSGELSAEAVKVAKDYSDLDQPGKNVVKVVIAEEGKRVVAERERRQVEPAEPKETRYIPLYYTPAAAGHTSPAEGEDYDYIEVGREVPWNADFAVKISGDSMEPYIRDGAIVYVNREPLVNGDVGIWCVDGDMICKQYYRDDYGNVHLLSINRARKDADRYIPHKDTDTVVAYYGRVILPRRPMISLL